jgi:hypothetical protein
MLKWLSLILAGVLVLLALLHAAGMLPGVPVWVGWLGVLLLCVAVAV